MYGTLVRTGAFVCAGALVSQTHFAPAKINLFLAITGRREDGFHDLVSVVAPIELADELTVTDGPAGSYSLTTSDPDLKCDDSNLVLKAARAFATRAGWAGGASFRLNKRVPVGAGLGGGSSDAATTLRLLNERAGNVLDSESMERLAASLGSDCALFLRGAPVVMRGRGERVEDLAIAASARIRGRRVLVFKPSFGIATAWAYRRLAEMPSSTAYLPVQEAERRLADWLENERMPLESLLFNSLELPAFEKFVGLPTLLDQLRRDFGLQPRMSGSGSACFALLTDDCDATPIFSRIRDAWGDSAFIADTRFA